MSKIIVRLKFTNDYMSERPGMLREYMETAGWTEDGYHSGLGRDGWIYYKKAMPMKDAEKFHQEVKQIMRTFSDIYLEK